MKSADEYLLDIHEVYYRDGVYRGKDRLGRCVWFDLPDSGDQSTWGYVWVNGRKLKYPSPHVLNPILKAAKPVRIPDMELAFALYKEWMAMRDLRIADITIEDAHRYAQLRKELF